MSSFSWRTALQVFGRRMLVPGPLAEFGDRIAEVGQRKLQIARDRQGRCLGPGFPRLNQAVVEPLLCAETEQPFAAIVAGEQIGNPAIVAIGSGVFPGRTDCVADFPIGVADTGGIELVSKRACDLVVPRITEFCGREFGFHRAFGVLPLVVGIDDFGSQAIELLKRPAVAAVA